MEKDDLSLAGVGTTRSPTRSPTADADAWKKATSDGASRWTAAYEMALPALPGSKL